MLTLFPRRRTAEEPSTPTDDGTSAPADELVTDETDEVTEEPARPRFWKRQSTPDVAHGWTNGDRFKSVAATVALYVCCGAGVVSLAADFLGDDSAPQAPAASVQDAGSSQKVSEFATSFVTRYLTSSRDQQDAVTQMLAQGSSGDLTLPDKPSSIGSATPGQAVQVGENSWVVTVAVEQPAKDDDPSVRRYWQVPVVTDASGDMAAGALPSLVAGPTSGNLATEQGDEVSDAAIEQPVTAFVKAYLAGQGEVAPLLAPGADITAVTPTPFTEVSVPSVRTRQEIPAAPSEGDAVRTQITVTATADDGSKTQLAYTVELRFRDRWEISAINPTSAAPTSEGEQSS